LRIRHWLFQIYINNVKKYFTKHLDLTKQEFESKMSTSNYAFKTALITGGGGGIGKALATQLIRDGKKVIIAGRTESNLQTTSKEIGAAAYYVLDTGHTSSIPSFIQNLITEHPDVDCLINNAGVQRPLDVNSMTADKFCRKADEEIDINIRGRTPTP
jgi:short-subunit dehydrogenase involved in D-alanine esterification of teichoic acids